MKQTTVLVFAAIAAIAGLPALAGGDSSDGHTHEAPAPAVTSAIAPRAVAATEEFEVVAVYEANKLVVYVDRFASNEPVTKAKVEIDGAGLKGLAGETSPGVYTMNSASPLLPRSHPLTISIEAGDTSDLLTATLDLSRPTGSTESVVWWRQWYVWIGIGTILVLTVGALTVARRLKKRTFSGR